jgi:hypothetical protein
MVPMHSLNLPISADSGCPGGRWAKSRGEQTLVSSGGILLRLAVEMHCGHQ